MEKISIFIVLTLLLFIPDATGLLCSYNKYYKKGEGCVLCPPCPPGEEFRNNCGYNEAGDRTSASQCQRCEPGLTFKDKKSSDTCDNCQLCKNGKVPKKECTLTSNTVCECPKGTYEYHGVCRRVSTKTPVTSPLTTPIITTTAHPVTTPNITTTAQVSTRIDEPRNDEPMAQLKRQPDRPFPQPGWIVLFCLLGFLIVIAFIFVSFHKRTRKQISGFCCRKYRVLWPDQDPERTATSDFVTVEDHYKEQATNTANCATPIPPCEEPVPPVVQSSSTSEQVYCSCATKNMEEEKMHCACNLTASDATLYKMTHTSSSAETISEEPQYYCQGKRQRGRTPTRKSSPSHSNSSGVFSSPSPDLCHLISPCVTPQRGLSPDHHYVTSSSSSSSPGMTSRGRSPEHHCVTSSSSSTCEIPPPPREVSPEHYYDTSSSSSSPGVTPPRRRSPELYVTSSSSSTCVTPLRGRSPDLPSIQIQFSDEQESSNQSNECSEIPVSIEACDKKHDVPVAPTSMNSSPPARQKISNSQPSGKRNSLSPKKDLICACQHELSLKARSSVDPNHCGEAEDKEKDVRPVPPNKGAEFAVGIDIKMDEMEDMKMKANVTVNNRRPCKYRPIKRDEDIEHRCPACCPQPSDSFFQLINRERLCLKEEICKELDRSFKDLAILGRVESEMKEYEASSNPAERVLERLKALHPGMKLEEFEQILLHIKRLDIVEVIHNHHLSCTFCRRNRFDSKT